MVDNPNLKSNSIMYSSQSKVQQNRYVLPNDTLGLKLVLNYLLLFSVSDKGQIREQQINTKM